MIIQVKYKAEDIAELIKKDIESRGFKPIGKISISGISVVVPVSMEEKSE